MRSLSSMMVSNRIIPPSEDKRLPRNFSCRQERGVLFGGRPFRFHPELPASSTGPTSEVQQESNAKLSFVSLIYFHCLREQCQADRYQARQDVYRRSAGDCCRPQGCPSNRQTPLQPTICVVRACYFGPAVPGNRKLYNLYYIITRV